MEKPLGVDSFAAGVSGYALSPTRSRTWWTGGENPRVSVAIAQPYASALSSRDVATPLTVADTVSGARTSTVLAVAVGSPVYFPDACCPGSHLDSGVAGAE